MRDERGQATVEWIGIVLLVALLLAGLVRVAGSSGDDAVAASVLTTMTCAARGDCEAKARRTGPSPRGRVARAVSAPPLVPSPRAAGGRVRLPSAGPLMRRLRKAGGLAWRRAWLACLMYERVRLGFEYPQLRFPGYTLPSEEVARVARTCILPVDAFPRDDPPAIP